LIQGKRPLAPESPPIWQNEVEAREKEKF